MKKTHLIQMTVMACLICFTACSGEQDLFGNSQNGEIEKVTVKANNFNDVKTKTTLTIDEINGAVFSWAANDTIGIFPNTGDQVSFPMANGAGTSSASFTGGGWALKSASTYYAYYPFNRRNSLSSEMANKIPVSYIGQSQDGDNSTVNLGKYDFMAAAGTQAVNGAVAFNLNHLGALLQLKLTMPTAATFTNVTLQTTDNSFVSAGTVDLTTATPAITGTTMVNSLSLGLSNITTTAANQTITLYMMIPPVDLSTKSLTVKVEDSNANVYATTLNLAKNYLAGSAYRIESNMTIDEAVTTVTSSSAGTLLAAVGGSENLTSIKSLKITGNINGTDVLMIRRMTSLDYLDLSDANIVSGGDAYYGSYSTTNNIIGRYMFYQTPIKKIILPNSITSIDWYAFSNCTLLSSVYIPNSVTSIGWYAFYWCYNLNSVNLPSGLQRIEYCTFERCYSLKEIKVPSSVVYIGGRAFYDCTSMKSFTILSDPSNLTLDKGVFSSDMYNNTTIYVPKGTKSAYYLKEFGNFTNLVELAQ